MYSDFIGGAVLFSSVCLVYFICQMCYKYITVEYIFIGIILNFCCSCQPIERTTLAFVINM